jgi:hypothetical protein
MPSNDYLPLSSAPRDRSARIMRLFFSAFLPFLLGIAASVAFDINDALGNGRLASGLIFTLLGFTLTLQYQIWSWLKEEEKERSIRIRDLARTLRVANDFMTLRKGDYRELWWRFSDNVLRRTEESFRDLLDEGRFTLRASTPAAEYVREWGGLMDALMESGSTFDTVSNVVIWSSHYMGGAHSTYLQKHKAPGGVSKIRRVFVVPPAAELRDHTDLREETLAVLEQYNRGISGIGSTETKVLPARTMEQYEEHFAPGKQSGNFGIWTVVSGSFRPAAPQTSY